jgi:hypothetical protein
MYAYVYMYVHISIDIYRDIYIYIYISRTIYGTRVSASIWTTPVEVHLHTYIWHTCIYKNNIYIYIYIYIYIHIYIQIHTHIFMYSHIYTYIWIYTFICIYYRSQRFHHHSALYRGACSWYIHTYVFIHKYSYKYIYIYSHIYTYIQIYIHIYVYTYIYYRSQRFHHHLALYRGAYSWPLGRKSPRALQWPPCCLIYRIDVE